VPSFPKTLSIPEAGAKYFGLSKNGSYDAAARGEIPFIEIGRLKRVPVAAMERMMEECGKKAVQPPPASRRAGRSRKAERSASATV
jgi:excisionase family DNA binding protein